MSEAVEAAGDNGDDTDADADDRAATERARYLDRTTSLDRDRAEAVAYAELGFSDAGIANRITVTEGTVTAWLDEVADRFGVEAVHATPADDRGDLSPTATSDPPTPDWNADRRTVIVDGDANPAGAHVERYFRTWVQNGRVHRQAKVAVRLVEFAQDVSDRLGRLDWDDHHATWNDDYTFVTGADGEPGAWTADADPTTAAAMRRAGVPLPPLDDLATVAEVWPRYSSAGRECPVCHADAVCSRRDLDAFHSLGTAGSLVARGASSHVCLSCRRFLDEVDDGDGDDDGDDNILAEVMA